MLNKKNVAIIIAIIILISGVSYLVSTKTEPTPEPEVIPEVITPEPEVVVVPPNRTIGISVEGRKIESYSYGTGSTTLLFVGGMHGGYEWNSVLLAYEFIDHLESGEIKVPDNLRIEVVPDLNPDGLFSVIKKEGRFTLADVPANEPNTTGAGRFNANNVDLNRNFACKWAPESSWKGNIVSAGSAAFSEPEAVALRDLVAEINPATVVFWHSQANTVYASECLEGILPATLSAMETYATAAGYNSVAAFDAYPITGDSEGWLASIGIPAITVELKTRTDIEWTKNRAGIESIFNLYAK